MDIFKKIREEGNEIYLKYKEDNNKLINEYRLCNEELLKKLKNDVNICLRPKRDIFTKRNVTNNSTRSRTTRNAENTKQIKSDECEPVSSTKLSPPKRSTRIRSAKFTGKNSQVLNIINHYNTRRKRNSTALDCTKKSDKNDMERENIQQSSSELENYDITLSPCKLLPKNSEDYGLSDISSDDEDNPKKILPSWAKDENICNARAINSYLSVDLVSEWFSINTNTPKIETVFLSSHKRKRCKY